MFANSAIVVLGALRVYLFFFCKMIDKKINPEVIIVCMGSIEVVTFWGASVENLPGTIHVAFKGNAHLAQKIISSLFHTIMIQNFRTYRSRKTVQTQIRLLQEEQSDQGLHCLLFHLHLSDEYPKVWPLFLNFR